MYVEYHDREWGVPERDDGKLFEFLVLEGAQAGLSWISILRRREEYRRAFDGFDPERIARYDEKKIESLMQDRGIIRNRRKIEGAVANARAFLDLKESVGSFSSFFWDFVDDCPIVNRREAWDEVPPSTPLSVKISGVMKKKGFVFFGPVICYSHMQAMGLVNDHLVSCFRHMECNEK